MLLFDDSRDVFRVEVQPNPADLMRAKKALDNGGAKARRQIINALNRTGRYARRQLVQGARATYAFKPGFRIGNEKQLKMDTASPAHLNVVLKSTGRTRTLNEFLVEDTGDGLSAAVLKGEGLKALINNAGNKAFGYPTNNGKLPAQREGKPRKPVKVLHGPSEPKMFEMIWKGEHGGPPMGPPTRKRLHNELKKGFKSL